LPLNEGALLAQFLDVLTRSDGTSTSNATLGTASPAWTHLRIGSSCHQRARA
jgi:hypothetical protein